MAFKMRGWSPLSKKIEEGDVDPYNKQSYGKDEHGNLVSTRLNNPDYMAKERKGSMPNYDEEGNIESTSTHLMMREFVPGRGWVTFPSLFQVNGEWKDLRDEHWEDILPYADKLGETLDWGEDLEGATTFADEGSWKDEYNRRYKKDDK